ncbi:hypothetical protein [Reyranella soli]|uniref:Uncharacterized protein n=1 Tax=Reyranella soli TaxID=1230389 RepID=A0A512NT66_9HYPH|nr:hypothetical protein [Reyranella soli]GEP62119.1 hypothetical protein RSO01_92850 [Reyranella soli]
MMKNVSCAVAAFALLSAASGLAQAQDGVVLDYTKRGFRDAAPAVAAADKTRVTSALAATPSDAVKALGKNRVVLGQAKGKSAKAGDVDFFLLSEKPPIAAEPFPKAAAQVIVALKGKDVVGTYVLPAERQYARLVGAVDMDGDNASEVLLEGSGYNMGQLIMAVDAVKLEASGTTRVAQSISEVYWDGCENPAGKKARSAKTISLRGGKLVETVHPEKCG